MQRMLVLGYGAWSGWLAALLVADARLVTFVPRPPGAGVPSWCYANGYPKQQDYFWYAAAVAAAVAGACVALLARKALRALGWRGRASGWILPAAAVCLSAATALLVAGLASPRAVLPALLLALAGMILPWLDRGWTQAELPPLKPGEAAPPPSAYRRAWAGVAIITAIGWVVDPCLRYRALDGLHEGFMLLYVQGWLAGDVPNLDTRTAYGPLYWRTLIGWMRAGGLTMSSLRYYFATMQVAGTLLHLLLVRLVCRSWLAALTGAWLMLTCTTAPDIQYGWANALRSAAPLAALWACWRGAVTGRLRLVAAAGALNGGWLLYSQEHAAACGVGSLVLLAALGFRDGAGVTARRAAAWAGAGVAMTVSLLAAMSGRRTGEAMRLMLSGSSLESRLLGFGAFPLPNLPATWSLPALGDVLAVVAIWGPALVGGLALAWLVAAPRAATTGRGALALGLAAAALIEQVPMLTLPRAQIESSAPAAILLAALALDHAWGRGLRHAAAAAALVVAAVGFGRILPYRDNAIAKLGCLSFAHLYPPVTIQRLGTLEIPAEQNQSLANFLGGVRALCPPGKRIFFGAVSYEYVVFLADRAALPPFPRDLDAGTAAEQDAVLAALEREKPPVALLRDAGLFQPYAVEHPRELAYIKAHYTLQAVAGDVSVYRRNP